MAQALVRPEAGRLGQGGKGVEPLARLPAEAAGAGLVPQRQEQLVVGVVLALLGRRQGGLFCSVSFTAMPRASVARIMPQVVPMMPPTRARTTNEAASTDRLCRRTNLRNRYPTDGGQACTGSLSRYRWTSAAKALADS
jgi:hypothetical protein